jgi:hypothetical protein
MLKESILAAAQPFPIAQSTMEADQTITSEIENSEQFRVSKTVHVGEESPASLENEETAKKKLPKWFKFNKS